MRFSPMFPARARVCLPLLLLLANAARADTLSVKVGTPAGTPLADAVVLALPARPPAATRPRPMAIQQKDREFLPFVTVVPVGTAVTFPNRDPMLHHVYSFSPAKTFEIKLYSGDSPSVTFDKPGPVVLGCNIHDWMEAYIYVTPTPYFARSDTNGVAHLTLPAGAYTLQLWHPYETAPQQAAEIKVAGSLEQSATIAVSVPKRKPKPPLDPKQYGN